ncbi:hypothetical protein [Gracilibacillus alcaliphilus]|uniref:hypothetical protein n=1 Tax=Gracilibacillus alcaliphilus TaxID=1401441 RepID=UPI00195A8017|nr:hypothetical protein [Gracilibacillus alcaliphilus]MBM7679416.1 hypothetical protein [Gracilibacillus alcaliphilus]
MDEIPRSTKEKIVKEEIKQLFRQGYLTEKEFHRFMQTYQQYHLQQKEFAQLQSEMRQEQETETVKQPTEPIDQPVIKVEPSPAAIKKPKPVKQPNEKPPKPKKTSEQIRERNITWLLIIGVVFLLISGLVVATSTWDQMGALMKVITLLGVSLFFLALSMISSKFLKIEKTAFAFLTLGSLLLPIGILAIGYFGLLGSYLTIDGEGRYILGMMCTLIPLPLYVRNALVSQARLFVWISFLFLSFFVGFLFAALQVPVDLFYLLIMLYNAALLFSYHRFHRQQQTKSALFFKELPAYAQLNLIVSTLLMLAVFDQALFYSFNVLLTAVLYMAMVFVYHTKTYQFVFVVLFAYGVFQLTESSWLQSIDIFVYALLGAGYILFAYLMRKDSFVEKVFHYTAGIITFFAFIYISFQGLVIRGGSDSWTLLFAYLVVAGTYLYLSHITNRQVFRWLAPIFLFVFGLQLWNTVVEPYFVITWEFFLFVYAGILFVVVGVRKKWAFTQPIQTSTYYLSAAVMLIAMLNTLLVMAYMELTIMLVLLGVICLIVAHSANGIEKQTAEWLHAVSWIFALFVLYPELTSRMGLSYEQWNLPIHVAVASLILLGVCKVWDRWKKPNLARAAFYIGQVSYCMAILQAAVYYFFWDGKVNRSLIFLVGIAVAIWFVKRSKSQLLWSIVALTTLFFYMSLYSFMPIDSLSGYGWYMVFAPVLLLIIDWYAGKYDKALKPHFFKLAHVVILGLLLLFAVDFVMDHEIHPAITAIPTLIYVYSAMVKQKEWQIKLSLFAGMTMIPWMMTMYLYYYDWQLSLELEYIPIFTSILFLVGWIMVPLVWKKRIEWYMIPFIHLNQLIVVSSWMPGTFFEIVILLAWMVLALYLLHVRKWLMFSLIPVIASIIMWNQQQVIINPDYLILLTIGFFVLLIGSGSYVFTSLYLTKEKKVIDVDWYAVGALLYVFFAFTLSSMTDNIWLQIVPYLMLASWLYLQIKRVHSSAGKKTLVTLSCISLLPAYYIVLEEYLELITPLLHAEFKALPILLLSILLAVRTWRHKKNIMNHVQTVILIFITVYLINDAIQSSTVWDAIIIGTLSLASFLTGMKLQIKSYFFVGLGTLLFNVMYQTRPYWGNLPWWGYLLIVGVLLIAIASYNEWQKQRESEGKLVPLIKKALARFKEWD